MSGALFFVGLSSNKVSQRMLFSVGHRGIFICLHFFDSRIFFSSLKFLVTEWGKKFPRANFPVCFQERTKRRIVCIRHQWQVRTRQISRHHSGISSWWSRYRGWSHFQERKVECRASALIFVSLLRHKQFRWAWKKNSVLIWPQSKQLRLFGKYTKIVYLFFQRIRALRKLL